VCNGTPPYYMELHLGNKLFGIGCDYELLVRGDHVDLNLGIGSGDEIHLTALEVLICLNVKLDAEELHILHNVLAELSVILAYSRGKYDCVKTVHCGGIGTDELLDLVCKNIDCKLCSVVTLGNCGVKIAAIGRNTGNAKEAALLVHKGVHLVGSEAFLLHYKGYDRGVHIAATGTHYNACKRSKAHAGIDALTALNCGDGGTVTKVAGDDLGLFCGLVKKLYALCGNVAMGGAVCAVAADLILLVHLVGDAVNVSRLGHGGMEGRVKYENLGSAGHSLKATLDTHYMSTGVKRCKIAAKLKLCKHLVAEKNGFGEICTTVHDAVTHRLDLAHAFYASVVLVKETLNYKLCRLCVVGHWNLCLVGIAVDKLLVADLAVKADTVAKTLCENGVTCGVEKLILKRAGTCVYNKYVHCLFRITGHLS